MVSSAAATVPEYLKSLDPERRKPIKALRTLIRKHIPKGYKEVMQYGMISWVIPLSRYPVTYNGQPLAIASLASQKQYMSLYLMGVYGDPKHAKRFEAAWKKSGKKLNMGKSCLRFKSLDDLALDVVADTIATINPEEFIAFYEKARGSDRTRRAAAKLRKSC